MRNLILTLSAFSLVTHVGLAEAVTTGSLDLASDAWPPFTGGPGDPHVAMELVEEALKRGGMTVDMSMVDSGGLIPRILEGDFHGTAALWKTAEREKDFVFSRPYLENRLVLVGRAGTEMSPRSLSELAGKRVGIVAAYAYGDEVKNATDVRFVEGSSDDSSLRRLLSGEVDYVLADSLLVHHLLKQYGDRARRKLAVGRHPVLIRPLHFALRRDMPGAKQVIEKFDRAIGEMIADGSFNEILEIRWLRVDVDGDGQSEFVLGGDRAGSAPPDEGYDIFMPPSEPAKPTTRRRFWIDNKPYDGWENVPPRFKREEERVHPLRTRPGGLKFHFDIGL